jgi:hypothetical protein
MSKVYSQTCVLCSAPARNNLCSNVKCKSWKKYRKQAANSKAVSIEPGLTTDDPIIVHCPYCGRPSSGGSFCSVCGRYFTHLYVVDRWYLWNTSQRKYVMRYIGTPNLWDYKHVVVKE